VTLETLLIVILCIYWDRDCD